ncbi:MAG TPA: ArsR family transcriptional regulator [Burkholderiaceae bacterium]|nr:ArsR family transcriptional regulator [Burkholderiaceae bacterium]
MSKPRSTSRPPRPPQPDTEPAHCGLRDLPDSALEQVAGFFQLLAEPSRLRVLNLLREQPLCVGDLARASFLKP